MSRRIVLQALGGFSPPDPGGPSDTRHEGHGAHVGDAGHAGHAGHVGHVPPLHCETEHGGQVPLFPAPSLSRSFVIRNVNTQPRPRSVITPSMLPRVSGLGVCNESDLVTRQCVTPPLIISSSPKPSSVTVNVTPPPPFPPFIYRPAHSDLVTHELSQSEGGASQEPREPPHHVGGGQGEEDPDETRSADEEDVDPFSDQIEDNNVSEQLNDQEPVPASDGNRKRRKKKHTKKEEMAEKINKALDDCKADKFVSINACAQHYGVPRSTLATMIKENRNEWKGRGKKSVVFSDEEEKLIKENIIERCELGVGLTIEEVWLVESSFSPPPPPQVCDKHVRRGRDRPYFPLPLLSTRYRLQIKLLSINAACMKLAESTSEGLRLGAWGRGSRCPRRPPALAHNLGSSLTPE